MKTLKNLKLRASVLGKAEMKQISAGNYGGYACDLKVNDSQTSSECATAAGNACMAGNSKIGFCDSYFDGDKINCHCNLS